MAVSPLGALVAAARVTVTQRSSDPIFDRELLGGSGEVVALSGGAALGSAQVGMLQALADAGVRPALLLGTSAGAINASFFAADPTPRGVANLADIWLELTTHKVFGNTTHRAANLLRGRSGLSSPQGLREVGETCLGLAQLVRDRVGLLHHRHVAARPELHERRSRLGARDRVHRSHVEQLVVAAPERQHGHLHLGQARLQLERDVGLRDRTQHALVEGVVRDVSLDEHVLHARRQPLRVGEQLVLVGEQKLVQIAAALGQDALLLQLAAQIEAEQPWVDQLPTTGAL